mgnify:FL=1
MSRKTRVLSFTVTPEMEKQIKALAQQQNMTQSELIRHALRIYMQRSRKPDTNLASEE